MRHQTSDVSLYSVNNAWVLEIHGPINGSGHLHREADCTYDANYGIIKKGVGAYLGKHG